MRVVLICFAVAVAAYVGPVAAQPAGNQCGAACQKCADELGYPRDAQGNVVFRMSRSGGSTVFQRCVEEKRQSMGSGKR